jgi:hypothetical protein
MLEILDTLPPAVMLVLTLLLLVWLVLLLLVPFMIEGIRGATRKTYLETQELNKKLDRLILLLEEQNRGGPPRLDTLYSPDLDLRAPDARSVRREPTISD